MSGTSPTPTTTLWTQREAADFLRCSPRTLERLRVEGEGPPYARVGRLVRYDPDAVRAWLKERTRGRRPEPRPAA
jgi:excisionase family DNA binding protein